MLTENGAKAKRFETENQAEMAAEQFCHDDMANYAAASTCAAEAWDGGWYAVVNVGDGVDRMIAA